MRQWCGRMVMPVSYTHLDVYKRQQKGSTLGTYQEYVEIRCFLDGTELDLKDVEA